jgi:hypothetical protein
MMCADLLWPTAMVVFVLGMFVGIFVAGGRR